MTALIPLAAGLGVTLAAQAATPHAPPLYDGVVVQDPYRFLSPPPGGDGSPTSATSSIDVPNGPSPAFAVYTAETPPQAELLARGGEFSVPAGTSLTVTIEPIQPPAGTPAIQIAGNVYRFQVNDKSGTIVPVAAAQSLTVALRAPPGISPDATIARFSEGKWQTIPTQPSGLQNLFIADATALGDFAVTGPIAENPSGVSPELLVAGLVAAGLVALLGVSGIRRIRASNTTPPAPPAMPPVRGRKGRRNR